MSANRMKAKAPNFALGAFSCLERGGAEGQSRTDTGCPTGF